MASVENKNMAPALVAVANGLILGILGYILIGQTNKGLMVFITFLIVGVVGIILCGIPGLVMWILVIVDGFQTATAIQAGEEIDENEYKNELLYKICKIIHKDAVFNG